MAYVARTPGQKCQCCGKDISDRSSGTKWCIDCSKEASKENAKKRKAYLAGLEARDKPMAVRTPIARGHDYCTACGHIILTNRHSFCGRCGQRLDWGENNG